jgi:transcriptional/translational regulatory protein YebC/TACO1
MTDNRNRTVAEIRKIFEKHNGVLGGAGTAGWAFEKKGLVQLVKSAATEDQLMEVAVGAGAEDYSDAGEDWALTTPPDSLNVVLEALEKGKITVKGSSIGYVPKSRKALAGRDAEVAINLAEALDDHDDVQNVYADFDVSDEEMARLGGG